MLRTQPTASIKWMDKTLSISSLSLLSLPWENASALLTTYGLWLFYGWVCVCGGGVLRGGRRCGHWKEMTALFPLIHTSTTQEEEKPRGVPGLVTTVPLITGCREEKRDIYLISITRT